MLKWLFSKWYHGESKRKLVWKIMKVKTQVSIKCQFFFIYPLSYPSCRVTECSPCGPCMCLHIDVGCVYVNVSVLHLHSGINASRQQNWSRILRLLWATSCRIEETEEERIFHSLIQAATLAASDAFHHNFFFIFSLICPTFLCFYTSILCTSLHLEFPESSRVH